VREHLQQIANLVKANLPPGWTFFLLCTPVGERQGRANYVSKMTRESAIARMKEFIAEQTDSGVWGEHEP